MNLSNVNDNALQPLKDTITIRINKSLKTRAYFVKHSNERHVVIDGDTASVQHVCHERAHVVAPRRIHDVQDDCGH